MITLVNRMATNRQIIDWVVRLILALLTLALYFILGISGSVAKVLIILLLLGLLVFVAKVFIFYMTRD